jgi:hypothetical protein
MLLLSIRSALVSTESIKLTSYNRKPTNTVGCILGRMLPCEAEARDLEQATSSAGLEHLLVWKLGGCSRKRRRMHLATAKHRHHNYWTNL